MMSLNKSDTISLGRAVIEAVDVTPGLGAFFKSEFLVRRRLRAAIFEGDFRDAEQSISTICREHAVATVSCISLDDQATVPAFRFAPSHEDLKAVRDLYHTPSYVIRADNSIFMIVSDSDYYWGFAAAHQIVSVIAERNSRLLQTRADVHPFLDSRDAHDRRIGAMLSAFHDICDRTAAAAL